MLTTRQRCALQGLLQSCGAALRAHVGAATGAAAAGLAAAGVEVGLPAEAPVLAAAVAALERRGGVPPGSLPRHVPGLLLDAHHLATL